MRRGWMILYSIFFFLHIGTRRLNVLNISTNTRTYDAFHSLSLEFSFSHGWLSNSGFWLTSLKNRAFLYIVGSLLRQEESKLLKSMDNVTQCQHRSILVVSYACQSIFIIFSANHHLICEVDSRVEVKTAPLLVTTIHLVTSMQLESVLVIYSINFICT